MLHVHVNAACPCQCSLYIYIEMPECRTVRHPVSPVPDWKKLTMSEQVRYRIKVTHSGIFKVRSWTKSRDAGMLSALVSSMPLPSYASDDINSQYLACISVQNLMMLRSPTTGILFKVFLISYYLLYSWGCSPGDKKREPSDTKLSIKSI
jgi:hypothetical protein